MKNVLIAIDLQNDFIDMSLGTPEAVSIVDRAVSEIGKECYDTVIATMDTHPENYLETFEGKNLPVEHCIKGTQGWQINAAVKKALDERNALVIEKPTFGSLVLEELMRTEKPESVTLIGLCTDICVLSNALLIRAALPDTPIRVAADACAATSPAKHTAALAVMASCQIEIVEDKDHE